MSENQTHDKLRKKYNPDGSDLRKAQIRMLDLLIFLDNICKEHNLRYWLDGGTLLGSFRHNGFIPWDDDTDVCMPREDALKLKKILGDEVLDNGFVLQSHDSDPGYLRQSWFVLRDTKTEYIQDSYLHNRLKYKGVQIDIFIMENDYPPKIIRLCKILSTVLLDWPLHNIWHTKIFRPFLNLNNYLLDKIIYPMVRRIFKSDKKQDIHYGIGNSFENRYNLEWIYPLTRHNFENHSFCVPYNSDKYLSELYGDWATIPPESKRETHNVAFKILL